MELTDNAFTAPAVNSDGNKLTVTFKQAFGSAGGTDTGGATQDKGGNAQTSVQTGDTANVMFWGALLLFSCFVISGAYVVNLRKQKEVYRDFKVGFFYCTKKFLKIFPKKSLFHYLY